MKMWKPTIITDVEHVYGTSTSPIRVNTDASKAVLKLPSGCGSTDRLICEFVGTSLARWLDVPTPDFALIRTDALFVELMRGRDESLAKKEDGFLSRYEIPWRVTPQSMREIENKDFFTKVIFLDTWIRNRDRYSTKTGESSSRNTDNLFIIENGQSKYPYTAKAIDHSEAFRNYDVTFEPKKHFGDNAINDPKIYGNFPEFMQYLDRDVADQTADRLRQVAVSTIQEIFKSIPKSWKLGTKTATAFVSFIVQRAAFVADTLVKKLFPIKIALFP
jgi:hypothetical protein